jgi:hypothetical protein
MKNAENCPTSGNGENANAQDKNNIKKSSTLFPNRPTIIENHHLCD